MSERYDETTARVGSEETSHLLEGLSGGRPGAVSDLMPLVYDELLEVAHRQLAKEPGGHTLQTTGLVHEVFMRLVRLDRIRLADRAHFLALAGHLMRPILIDYAKRHTAAKRGRGVRPMSLDEARDQPARASGGSEIEALIDLDDALNRLARISERQARVVECRFFVGMSVEETADGLGVSKATVKRDWQFARAWLHRELADLDPLDAT